MIKNERQYKITKANARKFREALSSPEVQSEDNAIDPIIVNATQNAIRSQIEELESQIQEYEELKTGRVRIVEADSLGTLSRTLIKARIAAGLTQQDLATKLDLKPQQIQRYEESDYQTASLSRLIDVADAIGLHIKHRTYLGDSENNLNKLLNTCERVGLPKQFVEARLMSYRSENPSHWLSTAMDNLNRVFGWEAEALLSDEFPLLVSNAPIYAARFKVAKNRNERRLNAYTVYAHYLAMLLSDALQPVASDQLPRTAEEFYDNVALEYDEVSLRSVASYIWSLGIGILPLNDSAAFEGAYWRESYRHTIVLKTNSQSNARWLFDLLHDYFHATQHPSRDTSEILELAPNDPERINDVDEKEASDFAGEVILAGKNEELWEAVFEATEGHLPRLKSALPTVAKEVGVDLSAAANYLAHRVSLDGGNWWGAAANLQENREQPWSIVRDVFLDNFNPGSMAEHDLELISAALAE